MVTDSNIAFSEVEAIRSVCRENFYEFVLEFWDCVSSDKLVPNWHIEYLCNELQKVAERVFARMPKEHDLVINISPGSTKSTICSRMFPAWVWTRMPEARMICASYTHPLALSLSLHTRDVLVSERYRAAFPSVVLRMDSNTKGAFSNTLGGERRAYGSGGQVTGFHGHFIIVDDPIDPERAVSEAELKTVNRWMRETLPSRVVDKKVTPTILIMQRLHQDDPSAILTKEPNVRHICLPAEITDDIKPAVLKKRYKESVMDPQRLPLKILQATKEKIGEYAYSAQYLQTPVPPGGGLFKLERLHKSQLNADIVRTVRYWDKAGSVTKGSAFSVGVLLGKDYHKRIWILDVIRGRWEAAERESIIKKTAREDGKKTWISIEQEPGSGGKESAQSTVANLAGYNVTVDLPRGDKLARAYPFAVQINQGNVYMVDAHWSEEFLKELKFFPFSKFKDQVDASSAAFQILNRPFKIGAWETE